VLTYLNEILLSLIAIAVFYLVIKVTIRKDVKAEQSLQVKMLETNQQIKHEIFELKLAMEHLSGLYQQLNEKRYQERNTVETNNSINTSNEQILQLNDRYKEIFSLQKQGLTVEQIAKKLDKGNGEVSMILQLATNTDVKERG
jgi:DNA-binding NarL/FixJ family response regulator